ncbi:MAG: hypothetical protein KDA84_11205 [Planctomycetaceae bacterium]|nr:hypothetical protein [Planctomycetaceae bacterium]
MNTFVFLLPALLADVPAENPTVIVVVGAPGNEEYGQKFSAWAENWKSAATKSEAHLVEIGQSSDADENKKNQDRDILKETLAGLEESSSREVWLVLIGHGTFDGRKAKFNLRGPDVTANELADWVKPLSMPLAIINCASSSSPFINALSGPNRVVVTATKSGYEQNYARFGQFLSSAISDKNADLDKDGQTSLLEAYLAASASVQDFYKEESRLATEHALIDDNGDSLGTPADWFRGFRAVRTAKSGAVPDGNRANQFVLIPSQDDHQLTPELRTERDNLELQIAELRAKKSQLSEEDYYRRLEPMLVNLAKLYHQAESNRDFSTQD